jgi:hypothetical protein
MKNYIVLIIFLGCFVSQSNAQIINVESKRISTDTVGFSGKMGISLSASRFTQSYIAAEVASQIQWKTNRNIYLLVGEFEIVNAGGESFNNSGFGHFRYNRKLSEIIRGELFSQIQYNSVTKITKRILNGVGIRLKLSPHETAKIYWGIAIMNEYEELSAPKIINKDFRLSSYFSFTLTPVETIIFRNTTYVQPKTEDFKDYRISNNTVLDFGITEQLKFTTVISFLYDSRPPIDVPSINYQIKNGLHYTFN